MFGSPCAVEDSVAEIAEALERGVGGAGVGVDLLEKEVGERFGEFEGIRNVAARIFVNYFLFPGIETSGVEHVRFYEKNLRCGNDDADDGAVGGLNHPNSHSVIGGRPEEADALNARAFDEEGKERGEFIALRGGSGFGERWLVDGAPLLPDSVGVGRLVGDVPV